VTRPSGGIAPPWVTILCDRTHIQPESNKITLAAGNFPGGSVCRRCASVLFAVGSHATHVTFAHFRPGSGSSAGAARLMGFSRSRFGYRHPFAATGNLHILVFCGSQAVLIVHGGARGDRAAAARLHHARAGRHACQDQLNQAVALPQDGGGTPAGGAEPRLLRVCLQRKLRIAVAGAIAGASRTSAIPTTIPRCPWT